MINIPLLPIATHKDMESVFVKITPQDVIYTNFETSRLLTLTGNALTQSVCSLTASVNGSNSSHYYVIRSRIADLGFLLSNTSISSSFGFFGLRKRKFDTSLRDGTLSASVSSSNAHAGDYFDSGSGQIMAKNGASAVGCFLVHDGFFVVTSSQSSMVTSITSISYKARVLQTTLNVFCKCQPNELNFSLNPTAFSSGSVGNWMAAPFTASTSASLYKSDLVSSGIAWQPLITSVGLYDDDNNLLAIAKLAKPLRKPSDVPITFALQLDL